MSPQNTLSEDDLAGFESLVARLRLLSADDPARVRAEKLADIFLREGRRRRRQAAHDRARVSDAAVIAGTATGATDRREDAPLPGTAGPGPAGTLIRAHHCYVCKSTYRQVDAFYHRLCPSCAAENTARRTLGTDLRGRRALLTGGRVKIGFQLALMMLRDGADLTVTSRFPADTLRRFRAVPGSDAWWDRLRVVGIDLRDPRQVLGLCEQLHAEGQPFDILVNNAAQTVRRLPEAYALLAAGEEDGLPEGARVLHAPGFRPMPALAPAWPTAGLETASRIPGPRRTAPPGAELPQAAPPPVALPRQVLPADADEAGLLPDTAPDNSWSAQLGSLDPAEVLEVQLVNALAPALLCDRLLPLLLASPYPRRYIVNVTAVEGRFAVRNKTQDHPHTNMAKAALNMLTRTSAVGLARQGVHMCAVDTGWITDESPAPVKARKAAAGFRTPLDVVDGAARIYDPIVRGEAGAPVSGVFLKDYREAAW
ncbi:oxidoreductase [Kitasatospora sp. NE20-6]|uniref:SDR family oxidoreductase n=1 Tax=Kitasatospora sp. NE20-6 TaxID=2859066 RepID=UPI0034DCA847